MRSMRTGQCYRSRSQRFAILRIGAARRPAGYASARPWTSVTSRSRDRSASASRRSPIGSARASMRRWSSTKPTIRSSPTSTPNVRAPRFQAQLFFPLDRHRQQTSLRQTDLFSQITICDYLFDTRQDLRLPESRRQRAVHLPAAVRAAGARHAGARPGRSTCRRRPTCCAAACASGARAEPGRCRRSDDDYVRELNEAYNHFFFHYTATPLLVVETSQFDLTWGDEALDDLERQIGRWEGHAVLHPRVDGYVANAYSQVSRATTLSLGAEH